MKFIGQDAIVREVFLIIDDIKSGNNHNILFRAPSGMGKTFLSFILINDFGLENSMYYLPDVDGNSLSPRFIIEKRFHVIDEIHTFKPQESLYPLMDGGKYSFLLMTNETGLLKEPLYNRCIQFNFEPYSKEHFCTMVSGRLAEYNLSEDLIDLIARRCRSPREVKILCERLIIIFKQYIIPNSIEEMENILQGLLQIDNDGLTNMDRNYLEILRRNNGRASLNTLAFSLRLDKATIMRDIEPGLLYTNKITISPRGRILIGE